MFGAFWGLCDRFAIELATTLRPVLGPMVGDATEEDVP
jgi:hypothetical protein